MTKGIGSVLDHRRRAFRPWRCACTFGVAQVMWLATLLLISQVFVFVTPIVFKVCVISLRPRGRSVVV
jgi:hypothetical protein